MAEEYSLIPAVDESGNETGYYTREPDGISGMTVTALANFCSTANVAVITNLLNRIEAADPFSNDLPECLKVFAGQNLRLFSSDIQGRLIVPDEACSAISEYYAFEARQYPGKQTAIDNYRASAKAGMRIFIWVKTGYIPQILRDSLKAHTSNYIDRLENTYDHTIADHLWSTFREGAEVLLLVEKQMRVPVDQMDLCDGSIGKHWSVYREGKKWAEKVESYTHVFRDQRGSREPKAYQLTELQYFRRWVREDYIPHHLPKYLADKFGKLAAKEIYRLFDKVTPRVLEVTAILRRSPAEERKFAEYQQVKERLLKEQLEEAESEQLSLLKLKDGD
jgi:hypothetical protein